MAAKWKKISEFDEVYHTALGRHTFIVRDIDTCSGVLRRLLGPKIKWVAFLDGRRIHASADFEECKKRCEKMFPSIREKDRDEVIALMVRNQEREDERARREAESSKGPSAFDLAEKMLKRGMSKKELEAISRSDLRKIEGQAKRYKNRLLAYAVIRNRRKSAAS